MTTILETERLRLREIEFDDAPFLRALMNEEPWLAFIGDRQIHADADAREYIRDRLRPSYEEHGFGFYLAELREDASPIGLAGIVKRDTLDDADLGFALSERHWGRGYAREASLALIDFARESCGLERLVAIVQPGNARSIRLLEGLGMSFAHDVQLEGEDIPLRLYQLEL